MVSPQTWLEIANTMEKGYNISEYIMDIINADKTQAKGKLGKQAKRNTRRGKKAMTRRRRKRRGPDRRARRMAKRAMRVAKMAQLLGGCDSHDRILEYQVQVGNDQMFFLPFISQQYDHAKEALSAEAGLDDFFSELELGDIDGQHQDLALGQKLDIDIINDSENTALLTLTNIKVSWRDMDDWPSIFRTTGGTSITTNQSAAGWDGIYGLQINEKTRKFIRKIKKTSMLPKSHRRISKGIKLMRNWRDRPFLRGLLIENRTQSENALGAPDNLNPAGESYAPIKLQVYQRMTVYRREVEQLEDYLADTLDQDAGTKTANRNTG